MKKKVFEATMNEAIEVVTRLIQLPDFNEEFIFEQYDNVLNEFFFEKDQKNAMHDVTRAICMYNGLALSHMNDDIDETTGTIAVAGAFVAAVLTFDKRTLRVIKKGLKKGYRFETIVLATLPAVRNGIEKIYDLLSLGKNN